MKMMKGLIVGMVILTNLWAAEWIQDTKADFSLGTCDGVEVTNDGFVQLEGKANWLSGWNYRRAVTIIYNGTSTLSDYQVPIRFYNSGSIYSSGSQSIRVCDSNGTTILPFWIENWDNNSTSTIWTKLDIPSGTKTVYLYYGNTSATNTSNFDAVFTKDYGPDPSLVGYWRMDEGSGTIVNDLSGNNNNGIMCNFASPCGWQGQDGGQWNGRSDVKFTTGNSLGFDGSNDYINCGSNNSLDISGNLTISAWVYLTAANMGAIVDMAQEGTIIENYAMLVVPWTSPPTFVFQYNRNSDWQQYTLANFYTLNAWQYVVVTYNNGTITAYKNGAVVGTPGTGYLPLVTNTANVLKLGRYQVGSQGYFNGLVDEIRIYNRALSAGEIKAHYERRKHADLEPIVQTGIEEGQYASLGTFTSVVFDAEGEAIFGTLTWVKTEPGTLTFQIATSTTGNPQNFVGPSGENSYYTTSGSNILSTARYIAYRTFFKAQDLGSTPKLDRVSIAYFDMKPDPSIEARDVTILLGTKSVSGSHLQAGAIYTIEAIIRNNKNVKADNVIVEFYISPGLTIGGEWGEIGSNTLNLPPNGLETTRIIWRVPKAGHGCMRVKIFCENDANSRNNCAQINLDAYGVAQGSSKTRDITIGNPTNKRGTITLTINQPNGWQATITPQQIVLDPGETITATIDTKNIGATPGTIATIEVVGTIETEDGTETIGGVTIIVSTGRITGITPSSGIVGTVVTVSGEGYGQGETISIDLGTSLGIATSTTDTSGKFSASFNIGFQDVSLVLNIIATSISIGSVDMATFTVIPGPLSYLAITPQSVTLKIGENVDLSCQGFDLYNRAMEGLIYTWSVSNGIGTLTTYMGSFTTFIATTPGNGSITAVSGTITQSIPVVVLSDALKLKIAPQTSTTALYSQFKVGIVIENVSNLFGALVKLGFDKNRLKVISLERGSFIGGADESAFYGEINEDSIKISASRFTGSVSGTGIIGTITFEAYSLGTSNIVFSEVDLRDPSLTRIPVLNENKIPGVVIIEGYLCDFGRLDSDDKITEKSDYKIDYYDLLLFTNNWNTTNNPRYDIGPATGTPPYLTPNPDGIVGFEDLSIFTMMWNWYYGTGSKSKTQSGVFSNTKVKIVPSKQDGIQEGNEFLADLIVEDVENLMASMFEIGFDPGEINLISIEWGEFLRKNGGIPVFLNETKEGRIELNISILGGNPQGLSGSGVIARIKFKALVDEALTRIQIISSDIRNLQNIKIKAETLDANIGSLPSCNVLLQSFPNPVVDGCWIPFKLAGNVSNVDIEIYNIIGQKVKTISAGPRKAGSYTQAKEGRAIFWNKTNDSQQKVSKGLYFYKLKADDFSDVKSMVVGK